MCCIVGVPLGSAAAAGGQVALRVPGVYPAPLLWLWAQCSLASFPGVRMLSHEFHSVALRAVGCWVLLCFRCSGVHWVRRALFVCFRSVLLVRARGPALCLEVRVLGLLAAACDVTHIPTIKETCVPLMVSCSGFGLPLHAQLLRLFVTKTHIPTIKETQ